MDAELIKTFVVATLSGVVLWFWKRLFGLEALLSKHKEHVSERYMPKEDILRGMAEIKSDHKDAINTLKNDVASGFSKIEHHLTRIEEKLDKKADK